MAQRGRRRTRKVKKGDVPGPNQCFPRVGYDYEGGCLPTPVLKEVALGLGLGALGSKHTLFTQIAKHYDIDPIKQRSVLNALPLPEEEKIALAAKWLRPAQPSSWTADPDMWLDSNNIRDVMEQYEAGRTDFTFLGPYPIDFA